MRSWLTKRPVKPGRAGKRVDLTHFTRVGSFPSYPQKLVVVPASTALPGGYSVAVGRAHLSPITPVYSNLTLVSEFYNTGLGHYFITGDELEKVRVRSGGAGAGWVETGQTFDAWSQAWAGDGVYLCRFYGDARGIDSNHRYVLDPVLLQSMVAAGWKDEGTAFCVPATAKQ